MRFARCALANPPLEKVEPNIHFFHEVMKSGAKSPYKKYMKTTNCFCYTFPKVEWIRRGAENLGSSLFK